VSQALTRDLGTRAVGVLRWLIAAYFLFAATVHFVLPANLPQPMAWMYDLDGRMHLVAGAAELLGALGLVLPRLLGVYPRLTAAAAAGLVLVMLSAAVWHLGRGEWPSIVGNLIMAALLAYVAMREWRRGRPRQAVTAGVAA